MAYTSIGYLVFILLGSFVLYAVVPKRHKWKALLAFSYIFYLVNSGKYIVYLLAATLAIYIAGLLINKVDDGFVMAKKSLPKEERKKYKESIVWQKKCVCVCAALFCLGVLVWLKYSVFIADVFVSALGLLHIQVENPVSAMVLPLGISFYTLSAVSYVTDVYRGKYRASENLGEVSLFLAFFPHIVEGPIARFDKVGRSLYEGHDFSYENMTMGLQLMLWGFFKKIVIADRANMYVNQAFGSYADYSGLCVVVAMLLYTLQLYAEFSGCMDIARGSACMYGVELDENFRQPFMSKTVSEFWRRWHMTLGAWFKEYVFYPVSLSKPLVKLSRLMREHANAFAATFVPMSIAMFVTWFGTGIWHGASWKYVMYGLYYWLIMTIGQLIAPVSGKILSDRVRGGRLYGAFQVARTFVLVNIGMLMFRADDLSVFAKMLVSMFKGFSLRAAVDGSLLAVKLDACDFAVLAAGAALLALVGALKEKGHDIRRELAGMNIGLRWACYYALLFCVIIFGAYGRGYETAGFIYGQF